MFTWSIKSLGRAARSKLLCVCVCVCLCVRDWLVGHIQYMCMHDERTKDHSPGLSSSTGLSWCGSFLGSMRPSSEAVFYDVAEEAISSSLYLKAVCTCRFAHSRRIRNVLATFSCWLSDGGAGSNYVVCVWSLPRGTRCRTVLGY